VSARNRPASTRCGMRRDGVALLAALAVLALIALLVVGSVATTVRAQRSSRLAHTDALLTAAADYALNSIVGDPTRYALVDLPFGQSQPFAFPSPGPESSSTTVNVTRLRSGVLWLVATSTLAGLDQGERRINLVARFPSVGALPGAAIVSRGEVSITADVLFASDSVADPDCSAPTAADIVVAPSASVSGPGIARVAHLQSATDSAVYFITAGQIAALNNANAVVHVWRDTVIAGGSFTGILVVDGRLTISGPFAATGLLIALGPVDATAGGLTLNGTLMSFAAPTDGSAAVTLAGASIRYGGCAISRAFRVAFPPRLVRGRSWAELF
ncbi:MAG: hypothetical protein ABI205_02880, partial [Gemmatimonadaceae bacterium]